MKIKNNESLANERFLRNFFSFSVILRKQIGRRLNEIPTLFSLRQDSTIIIFQKLIRIAMKKYFAHYLLKIIVM